MQRHVEQKFRNAFAFGLIALIVTSFALISRRGINAMAIYEGRASFLPAATGNELVFIIFITIASVSFILFALDFVISGVKFDENKEKRLREFAARCRGRGYSRDEISNLLLRYGWKESEIKNYLN
jgi:hypothetical protein